MKKQTLLLTMAVVMLTFFSCKPPKEFIDSLNVTPSPAEYCAGKVEVKIEGTFPQKYFTKKMEMIVTPYLVSNIDGKVTKAQSKVYQGEKVKGNATTVNYKVGGKYSQTAVFTYTPDMLSSQMWLEVVIKVGKKEYQIDPILVNLGVNVTPLLVSLEPGSGNLSALIAPDKFQRIIEEKKEADIYYVIQQAQIRNVELKRPDVVAMQQAISEAAKASNEELKSLEISSYCSPDGGMELNENLVNARARNSEKYYEQLFKKNKVQVEIDQKLTAEDWAGFKKLLEASNIQDKDVILRVLNMHQDPEQREIEMKKLAAAYKVIADQILPELRRSQMNLTIDIIGKSDEEIKELMKTDPKALTEDEILYCATLYNTWPEKAAIYKKCTEVYPNASRAYNNLGVAEYEQGQIDAAGRAFAKALQMETKNATYNYNNGLIALANGNISKAQEFFGNAGGVGPALNYANGAIAVLNCEYSKAVSLFGDSKSNNAAVANICNKNYTGAMNILNAVKEPNAMTYYLKAVVDARTNNVNALINDLTKAIQMNPELAELAALDVEFLPFADNNQVVVIYKK